MNLPQKSAVLVVHPEPLMRAGLKSVIDGDPRLCVYAEADTAARAQAKCQAQQPQAVILALAPAMAWGYAMLRDVQRWAPAAPIIVLTDSDDALTLQRSLEAGARGFLPRDSPVADLLESIHHALDGQLYVAPRMARLLLKTVADGAIGPPGQAGAALSEREAEIFLMIGDGKSTHDVAGLLNVSVKTIETHYGRIKIKLKLANLPALRQLALRSKAQAQRDKRRSHPFSPQQA